jgi:hypothetical protein
MTHFDLYYYVKTLYSPMSRSFLDIAAQALGFEHILDLYVTQLDGAVCAVIFHVL